MPKIVGSVVIVYGIALSILFGTHTLIDYEALQVAATRGSERSEMRHRLNVGFEGMWFLMSNILTIQGLNLLLAKNNTYNKDDRLSK